MAGERTLPGAGLTAGWTPGSSGWATGMDANLRAVSAVMQLAVESATSALPGSPSNGVIYILPASDGTHPKQVAVRDAGAWVYLTPQVGWIAWAKDSGKYLRYGNAETWGDLVPSTTVSDLDDLTDVDLAVAPAEDQFLKFNGAVWIASDLPTSSGGATTLDDLTDVATAGATTGQALIFNGTSWAPDDVATGGGGGGAAVLDDLSDVTLGTPQIGDSLSYDGSAWVAGPAQSVLTADSASRTLDGSDRRNRFLTPSSASAIVYTIPTNASVAFPIGTEIAAARLGSGDVSFAAASGVTLLVPGGLTAFARAQYSVLSVKKMGTDTWLVFGDLGA